MIDNVNSADYEYIFERIEPFVKENALDSVAVKSLLLGAVEVVEPEAGAANLVVLNTGDFSSAKSIKFSNVKINLKFALNTIFAAKKGFSNEGYWLILCILQILCTLADEMTFSFQRNDAIVIFAIYRLRSASFRTIVDYIKKLKANGTITDIDNEDIRKALVLLEKVDTIELLDGKYQLKETVWVKKKLI